MDEDWSFRVRLSLPGGRLLSIDDPAYLLDPEHEVTLRSAQPARARWPRPGRRLAASQARRS